MRYCLSLREHLCNLIIKIQIFGMKLTEQQQQRNINKLNNNEINTIENEVNKAD